MLVSVKQKFNSLSLNKKLVIALVLSILIAIGIQVFIYFHKQSLLDLIIR